MSHHHDHPEPPDRRTFLHWALDGLGAIFGVVFGVPIVAYAIDPRNRPKAAGAFRLARGVKVDDLKLNQPVQGTIRDVRWDAFTLYPDDVVGRVWVNRKKEGRTPDCFEVFATKCPHLGCSINCNPDQNADPGYTCPCHNGRFALDGARLPGNPATRGMYQQEIKIDDNGMWVKYFIPGNDVAANPKNA